MTTRNVVLLAILLSLSSCQRQNSPLTGEWVEKDGSRFCNGYMTRVDSEDFCVSEIPEDWVPFEFEGQTYFVQPLADGSEP